MIIYCITNTLNDKKYIGQTIRSLETRWIQHKSDALTNNKNGHLQNAIRKYGHEMFNIEIIEKVSDISLLNERETFWIDYYDTFNNGYNSTTGGENRIPTEETKEKMKQNHKGFEGKRHTKKTKEKMAQKARGRMHSEETKEKMRHARLGKEPWNKGKKGVQVAWNKGKDVICNKNRDNNGRYCSLETNELKYSL